MNSKEFTKSVVATLAIALFVAAPSAQAQVPSPNFSKAFSPATIGPGSTSTLTFSISNSGSSPVTDLDFTDNLPAGLTIAIPASAVSDCGGTFSAPDGGFAISLSDGAVGGNDSCTISVNVTGAAAIVEGQPSGAVYTNITSELTSSAGTTEPATAELTVDIGRPGFRKSFSPGIVPLGGKTKLTFTIDNTANASVLSDVNFTDNLPAGVVIAAPSNASSGCPGTLTAIPGTSVISFNHFNSGVTLAAGASCTISLDVVCNAVGRLENTSGELLSRVGGGNQILSSGLATALLTGTKDPIVLTKDFTNDPVSPGGAVVLEFTVINLTRNEATNISFTDDLNTTLAGLVATGLGSPISVCGGTLSASNGDATITFSGGTLPGNNGLGDVPNSCTIPVTLQVPTNATNGTYINSSGTITADVDGFSVSGAPASDVLFVAPTLELTKTFTDDPVATGGTVTLEFTITNPNSSPATAISFIDDFPVALPTAVSASIPGPDFCGIGSTATFTPLSDPEFGQVSPARLTISGVQLAATGDPEGEDSCTFSIVLDVSPGAANGTFVNTTGAITGTVNSTTVTGSPATDSFDVVGPPTFAKSFVDDPVRAGGTVNLEFSLTLDENAPSAATGIGFTDDLGAVLSGLATTANLSLNFCGGLLTSSGDGSIVSFTGGTLSPGASCDFSIPVFVPSTADSGSYTNTTGAVTATVGGLTVTGLAATDNLDVADLVLTKEFIDDPVIAGGDVALRFTVTNNSSSQAAAEITFEDDLDATLPDLAVTGTLPTNPCGAGSSIVLSSGNTRLTLVDGSLAADASCTFDVILTVPANALSDTYQNITTDFAAKIGGSTTFTSLPNASDDLVVSSNLLQLTKSFVDDPVASGGTVTLDFTLSNIGSGNVTGIAFTDNLGAALSGLQATTLPTPGFCGGATLSGTDVLTLTGGSLNAGTDCSFSVTVQVPNVPQAVTVINTTSPVSGSVGGLAIFGDPASDALDINSPFAPLTVTINQALGQADPTSTSPIVFEAVFSSEVVDFDSGDVTLSGGAVTPGQTSVAVIPVDAGTTYLVEVSGLTNIGDVVADIGAGAATDRFGNPNAASTSVDNVVRFIPRFVNQTIFGSNSVTINKDTSVTGNVASQQTVHIKKDVTIDGNVAAVEGDVLLNSGDVISGNVDAGGAVVGSTTGVSGTVNPGADLADILLPDLNFSAGGTNITLSNNEVGSLSEGTYGVLVLGNGAELTLLGGVYFFESIVSGNDSGIVFDAATTINVVGDVYLGNGSQMTGVDASDVLIQARGAVVQLGKGGTYIGTVLAPNAAVALKKESNLTGALFGNTVNVDKGLITESADSSIIGVVALDLLIDAASNWAPKVLGLVQGYSLNFGAWANAHRLSGNSGDDADRDGIPDALEFVLELDPERADSLPDPIVNTKEQTISWYLRLRPDLKTLYFLPEVKVSQDLVNWVKPESVGFEAKFEDTLLTVEGPLSASTVYLRLGLPERESGTDGRGGDPTQGRE